jgi:hypothetical protein
VYLNCLKGVLFGTVVVLEPGVGGGGVEEPFGMVEDKMVVRVTGAKRVMSS